MFAGKLKLKEAQYAGSGQMIGTDGVVTHTCFHWWLTALHREVMALEQVAENLIAVGGIFTRVGGMPCIGLCGWNVKDSMTTPVPRLLAGTVYTLHTLTVDGKAVGLLIGGAQLQIKYFTAYSVVLLHLPLVGRYWIILAIKYRPLPINY